MAKFEISKRKNGEYQFKLKASNGETILTSEGYKSKDGCKNGVDSVKRNSIIAERYEKKESTNKKYYFNLKASNGQVIGTSEMYENETSRDKGIESVKKNAPDATESEVVNK